MLLKNSFNKRVLINTFTTLCSLFLFTGCFSSYTTRTYDSFNNYSKYQRLNKQPMNNSQAMHKATMRPYKISGKWYYPTLSKIGNTQQGIASWYGPNFHLKKTSNGETYNMYEMTAAHKTLPMNTMVRVDNLENGRWVIVRINDRGPFVAKRIIDLSNKAANKIGMVKKGTAKVKLTILGFHGKIAQSIAEKNEVLSVDKYYLQVGAFKRYEGAKIIQRKFQNIIGDKYKIIIKKGFFNNIPINRVWISGFRSEAETSDFKEKLGVNGSMIIAQ